MKTITLGEKIRYEFDNIMARGPIALLGMLFLASFLIIFIVAFIISTFGFTQDGGSQLSLGEAFWEAMMRTLDSGSMGGDTGTAFRLLMFVVTLGGIFVVGGLIGILTTGLEGKLEEMRKGRSIVAETGHTVILGWSEQVFAIIPELVEANSNQKRGVIAILADKDKVEMEDEIRDKIGDTGKTKVVCRTGSPLEMNDINIVSPQSSRSIIILSSENDENADTYTIKTILALTNSPTRRSEPYHIVAEIRDSRNIEAARLVGKNEVELVQVDEFAARIIAQTCRQSGLSVVYTELLDFGGDEIYFKEEPALVGKTLGDALFAFETSSVIGLATKTGAISLNPPLDTRIAAGDQLIAISADDDTIVLSGQPGKPDSSLVIEPTPSPRQAERTLVLGWNNKTPRIITELDAYVAPGSELIVVADNEEDEMKSMCEASELTNLQISFKQGVTTSRKLLDSLDVQSFHHVIVVSYSDRMENQKADAITLITLLHLREIAEEKGQRISITSEMMDSRNRQLAEVTRADDFIISDKLVSLLLTQISENKKLSPLFADIFDPDGSEIYMKPARDFVALGKPIDFYTVTEAARRQNAIAIGYRIAKQSNDVSSAYGVRVNPKKSEKITFTPQDKIVVISEN